MLKYTMLHTTGYQKLLYGKENITPYLKFNNQYVPSLRLSMAECSLLSGPVIFSYLGGNSEEQLLKTDSRPTVGRQSADSLPSLLTINFHHLSPDCWPTVCEVLVMVNCGRPVGK